MLEKVQADRQANLDKVRELGIDPYGWRYDTAAPVTAVLEGYKEDAEGHALEGQAADVAGRVVLFRDMGKMIFAHLRDQSGQMQIALRKNDLDEKSWALAKLLDLGDIVAAAGPLQRTKTGEITVWAKRLTLLCKSLEPMPEKFHGLTDTETRYRQRYLDLAANPDSMAVFQKRVAIINHIRAKLAARGYAEVETPILQPIYGGGAARPFTTHHNTLDADLFLRISPELYLKRLLVGGMQKVFEIGRNFRNEGIDTRHNPEFTMMELYEAYADYEVMMEITEDLIATAAEKVAGGLKIPYGETTLDLTRPWPRATYGDLLQQYAGVAMRDSAAVRAKARELCLQESNKDDAVVINEVFEATVEPAMAKMTAPLFVKDYPAEICPLTRRKPDDATIALRFEVFIAGMEIGNAYTELNDPAIQEANFLQQVKGEGDGAAMRQMDEDFVTALRHGMPPAGGLGIGIDRVVMLLTNRQSIRDVVLFPLLRS
ncbi:MAG: lysine--tRNA ligase [Planctomycetaceae bacterium]|nr:lysine--tRNA ligase [Planctomycetaceae bacterium]